MGITGTSLEHNGSLQKEQKTAHFKSKRGKSLLFSSLYFYRRKTAFFLQFKEGSVQKIETFFLTLLPSSLVS